MVWYGYLYTGTCLFRKHNAFLKMVIFLIQICECIFVKLNERKRAQKGANISMHCFYHCAGDGAILWFEHKNLASYIQNSNNKTPKPIIIRTWISPVACIFLAKKKNLNICNGYSISSIYGLHSNDHTRFINQLALFVFFAISIICKRRTCFVYFVE